MVVTMQAVIPYVPWILLIAYLAWLVVNIVDTIQLGKFNQHYGNDLWQPGNTLRCWRDGNKWMRWRVAVMSISLVLQLLSFILILGGDRLWW
jgi:type II secretory pathway component PulL